jgi:hypothetical protein
LNLDTEETLNRDTENRLRNKCSCIIFKDYTLAADRRKYGIKNLSFCSGAFTNKPLPSLSLFSLKPSLGKEKKDNSSSTRFLHMKESGVKT